MNITVFCGAVTGNDPAFKETATELGRWMAENGHALVYGGGKAGMMGAVADGVLDNGGKVIGVTPGFFVDRDEIHSDLTELIVVKNLSERRNEMMELGDAFVALPGGMGTLDEISEIIANNRLRQFDTASGTKPAILMNVNGYYDTLLDHFKNMMDKGYYRYDENDNIIFADSIGDVVRVLSQNEESI
ncbi:MAG: TIGR00730 family Rossman fold protein [Mogibacterium sp.]|nr:TIGR00730 family Rossman fold protein [Mogibacterium sp.]